MQEGVSGYSLPDSVLLYSLLYSVLSPVLYNRSSLPDNSLLYSYSPNLAPRPAQLHSQSLPAHRTCRIRLLVRSATLLPVVRLPLLPFLLVPRRQAPHSGQRASPLTNRHHGLFITSPSTAHHLHPAPPRLNAAPQPPQPPVQAALSLALARPLILIPPRTYPPLDLPQGLVSGCALLRFRRGAAGCCRHGRGQEKRNPQRL